MNKILMDGDKLFLTSDIKNISVDGYATILINNLENDINLNIELSDNSEVNIFDFCTNSINSKINIIQNNNTKANFIHTFKISGDYNFDYKVTLKGNDNINNVNISGVSNGFVHLNVDGEVCSGIKNNELNENIRVLTDGGKVFCSPMLHVSALEVIANHNTAISNIKEDELFYLMSKGIDKQNASRLIQDGYIYGYIKKYNEEFYNLIKE